MSAARSAHSTAAPLLAIQALAKEYGDTHLAIRDVSLEARAGDFISIVGPSGCGKTTLMKCICGLLAPSSGEVRLHGKRVTRPPAEMVLVFQDYNRSLFPWLTVRGNVEMPLRANSRMRKALDQETRRRRVDEALDAVGLASAGEKFPWQLSGGMQQRLALARAVAFRPEILLLDEPFASVDALVRSELEDLTLALRELYGMTILLVTHDVDEAVYLSDQVFVLGASPSVVVTDIPIDLPHPRNQVETRSDPRFLNFRNVILGQITHSPRTQATVAAVAAGRRTTEGGTA